MTARLHHERIGSAPRCLLITHGILGSGANWRSIARKLVAQRPDWCVELVDLRQHGKSDPGEAPHTLRAAAGDLRVLLDELPDIVAVAGHSFGGKTVLQLRALAPARLLQTWAFDVSPGTRVGVSDPSVAKVLATLKELPTVWQSREAFVRAVGADGHALALAQWLAMSLVSVDGRGLATAGSAAGLTLRFDLAAIDQLVASYASTDLWPVVLDPELPGDVILVYAADSATFSAADRAQVMPPHVHVKRIEHAGHWVHIDAPDAVVALLTTLLPGL